MNTTIALTIASSVAISLLWLVSGASPFLWLSRASLHCEAIRLNLLSSIAVAARYFREEYARTHARVKAAEHEAPKVAGIRTMARREAR